MSESIPIPINDYELEYLQQRWEVRDVGTLMGWGIKLLYDLSKAEESSWSLSLVKMKKGYGGDVIRDHLERPSEVPYDPGYGPAIFQLGYLAPGPRGFTRIDADYLDRVLKKPQVAPVSGSPSPS